MSKPGNETVRATAVGQNSKVRHVLARAEGGELLAVTLRTFEGDWGWRSRLRASSGA